MIKLNMLVIMVLILSLGYVIKKVNNNETSEVNKLWGKELVLNDTILNAFYTSGDTDKKFKIISLVDGDCSCSIKTIEHWQEFTNNKLIKQKTDVIIFINSERGFFVHNKVFKEIAPDISFIFDPNSKFIRENNLNQITNDLMTFLIDSTNTVKLVGNPLSNKEIEKLYLSFLYENN